MFLRSVEGGKILGSVPRFLQGRYPSSFVYVGGHLVQPPCNQQGHLQLAQVAQSPVQPDLECFQGWGIYHLSGQSIPVFHHPRCENVLPHI